MPILKLLDLSAYTKLYTDASADGIVSILLQGRDERGPLNLFSQSNLLFHLFMVLFINFHYISSSYFARER